MPSPADSYTEMVQVVLPNDANPLGFILGGTVMHLIDIAGAIACHRHTRCLLVTAAVVLELHAKLPMGQKWQSACLGLLEGVVLAKVLCPGLFKEIRQDAWRITRSSVLNRSRRDQAKD